MQHFMQFLAENYTLVLILGVGLLLTQQRFPLAHLLLGARYITAAESMRVSKQSVIIDLRTQEQYQAEHVRNAEHYADFSEVPTSGMIYLLYGDDQTSYTQCLLALKRRGVTNTRIIIGGFAACKEAGLPLSTTRR